MNIPNMPNENVSDADGNISSEWVNFFSQLITELQLNLNNEGYKLPIQETNTINQLVDPSKSLGAMIYDSDTDEFKVNIAGVWRVVSVI